MKYTGVLQVSAAKKRQKTIISSCYHEGALKVSRPIYLEKDLPFLYLIHVGGGYVDGDVYLTNLNVEEEAELAVTTQSATKVYKTPKKPVVQKMNIHLKKGSVLEYLPDSLIAYKEARFIQETTVHIEEDSGFFYSDVITPGWAEDGSLFPYDWIRSKLKVYKKDRLVLFDHLRLEPDEDMSGMLQMDGYTHIGTFLIFHQKADKTFLDRLYDEMEAFDSDVRFGMTSLPESGIILRILAHSTGIIENMISRAHSFARRELLGKNGVTWRKY
ncbi:urease accessory protein UreD [Bacillus smithii]|jgi:urease accessory protein|uniref:urease accessory protein UreD n=1 Tax=Bacillus smithii TaxID=1479 RepID=UPI003D251F86